MATIHQMKRPPQPAVLTQAVIERLEAVNDAARALRSMGLRVTKEELFPVSGGLPKIEIERNPDVSIAPLLDAAHSKDWRSFGASSRGRAFFRRVVVTWWELK